MRTRSFPAALVLSGLAGCSAAPSESTTESGLGISTAAPVTAPATNVHAQSTPAGATYFASVCAPTDASHAQCHGLVRTDNLGNPLPPTTPPSGYGPADLQNAYGVPTVNVVGTGRRVAIVDAFDNPNAESDLAIYRAEYGLAPCTTANGCFRKLNQSDLQIIPGTSSPGKPPQTNARWGLEIALDLAMVSAACPQCKIDLVEANSDAWSDMLFTDGVAHGNVVDAVSNSWGVPESSDKEASWQDPDNFENQTFAGFFASTGNAGYVGSVEYPASSFYVTAVGGTTLSPGGAGTRGWLENAWVGTTSGCSEYISKPSWQVDSYCATRTVVDVAAVADPSTGVAAYDSFGYGGWLVVGGTGVAAPLVAAMAVATASRGSSSFYAPGRPGSPSFNDITEGPAGSCGYGLCSAGYGYDGLTGNGTPIASVWTSPKLLSGDFDGDGKGDLALIGGPSWYTIPVALSTSNGTFGTPSNIASPIATWATETGIPPLTGDFNGDGVTDIALVGGKGWSSIPVAFGGMGGFGEAGNSTVANFPEWATAFGVQAVAGDFDGDHHSDIALVGNAEWSTIPVAFSSGPGNFPKVTNAGVSDFPGWAAFANAKAVGGDFNDDGKTDIALVGGDTWSTIPVAFSNGDGSFRVTNFSLEDFPGWAAWPGARPLAGDFNGDHRTDIALVGGYSWSTIPVAYSKGDGTFVPANGTVSSFPAWASSAGAKAVVADLNGIGRADIVLSGGGDWMEPWYTIPIAFPQGDPLATPATALTFGVINNAAPTFAAWATP